MKKVKIKPGNIVNNYSIFSNHFTKSYQINKLGRNSDDKKPKIIHVTDEMPKITLLEVAKALKQMKIRY